MTTAQAVITSRKMLRNASALPEGIGCWKNCTCYCHADGFQKLTLSSNVVGRDRYENFCERLSDEDGVFRAPERNIYREEKKDGCVTRFCEPFIALDPASGSVFRFADFGTYIGDSNDYGGQNEFFRNVCLLCWRSTDGGKTFGAPENLTPLYLADHQDGRPLLSCSHLLPCKDKSIKIPCGVWAVGGTSWKCRVLTGVINADQISWHWGDAIPQMSDRKLFMSEFSIAEVPAGLLAIVRAATPGERISRKYVNISDDGGETWGDTRELCYDTGEPVISSDSCGYIVPHSNGSYWYISNIFEAEREPIYARNYIAIARLDPVNCTLIKDSVIIIDGLQPGDHDELAISNFSCYEDRQTGEIVVEAPVAFRHRTDLHDIDLMEYRIKVC